MVQSWSSDPLVDPSRWDVVSAEAAAADAWAFAEGRGRAGNWAVVSDDPTREEELDEALDDSFPASDPPAPAQPHPDRWYPNGQGAEERGPEGGEDRGGDASEDHR